MIIYKNQKIKFLIKGIAIIGLVSLGFFMQGCSQEDNYASINCDFQNSYDYVGKYHNEGLLYVLNRIDNPIKLKSDMDNIEQNASELTKEFCQKNPLDNNTFSEDQFAAAIQATKDIRLKSGSNNFSQTELYYHEKFENILKNPQGCSSLSDVYNQIRILEKEIYESNMSNEDKEVLLITYAVGRNSLEFWVGLNKNDNFPRLKSDNENSSSSFLDWWSKNVTPAVEAIVKSDFKGAAEGALTGLIAGASAGSVVPGAGTLTGAVTGGATGAVYGSVIGGAEYFFKF